MDELLGNFLLVKLQFQLVLLFTQITYNLMGMGNLPADEGSGEFPADEGSNEKEFSV